MACAEIEIPAGGAYFWANQCRYHITEGDGVLVVRCVEGPYGMSGSVFLRMPASNVIEIGALK